MTRFGVFIRPSGKLKELVCDWKARVEAFMPGQPYCSHPPHCTVIISALSDTEEWLDCMQDMIGAMPPFEMEVDDVIAFRNDRLAGGGHTLAFKAVISESLSKLQLTCAETMVNYIDHESIVTDEELVANEPYRSSYLRYGFPFVGEHWIPHFSVASLKTDESHVLIQEFMAQKPRFKFDVGELLVWRVAADTHSTVAEIPLR